MIKETTKESQCWEEWSDNILKAVKKICGISKGGHKSKITWWWNDEVKKAIKEKDRHIRVGKRMEMKNQRNSIKVKKGSKSTCGNIKRKNES